MWFRSSQFSNSNICSYSCSKWPQTIFSTHQYLSQNILKRNASEGNAVEMKINSWHINVKIEILHNAQVNR